MKKKITIMVLSILMSSLALAQPGRGQMRAPGAPQMPGQPPMMQNDMMPGARMFALLNLSEEQIQKIAAIRLERDREMVPLNAEIVKVRSELKLLKTEKNVNLKAINKKIDELSNIRAQKMKIGAKYGLEIRNILTDEQRLIWDAHMMNGRSGMGMKGRNGKGRGGMNRGMRPCGMF